jgi:hypothetical protein
MDCSSGEILGEEFGVISSDDDRNPGATAPVDIFFA